jgi:hypothetical protein
VHFRTPSLVDYLHCLLVVSVVNSPASSWCGSKCLQFGCVPRIAGCILFYAVVGWWLFHCLDAHPQLHAHYSLFNLVRSTFGKKPLFLLLWPSLPTSQVGKFEKSSTYGFYGPSNPNCRYHMIKILWSLSSDRFCWSNPQWFPASAAKAWSVTGTSGPAFRGFKERHEKSALFRAKFCALTCNKYVYNIYI